jgi:hypothetical protein
MLSFAAQVKHRAAIVRLGTSVRQMSSVVMPAETMIFFGKVDGVGGPLCDPGQRQGMAEEASLKLTCALQINISRWTYLAAHEFPVCISSPF